MFFEWFKINKKCNHAQVPPNVSCSYCPDCGKLVQNEWYIARCACCGVKLKARVQNNKIMSSHQYCCNCGSKDYRIEKLDQISFININFAVLVKRVIEKNSSYTSMTQCWQERKSEQPKLLIQYQ